MISMESPNTVNFQKMWKPLFIFYSKFLCSCHTNRNLAILWVSAEGCIGNLVDISKETLKISISQRQLLKYIYSHISGHIDLSKQASPKNWLLSTFEATGIFKYSLKTSNLKTMWSVLCDSVKSINISLQTSNQLRDHLQILLLILKELKLFN